MLEAEQNWLGQLMKDIEDEVITERKDDHLVLIVNYNQPTKVIWFYKEKFCIAWSIMSSVIPI
ncbi:hypothetical protein ASG81_12925 [Paenibacillus sp. Soil522]|nr:hypothetical protein ASG81_12925 [Paenibacillus sp. Soil522]